MEIGIPELIVGAVVLAFGLVGLIATRRWFERTLGPGGYKRMSVFSRHDGGSPAKSVDPIAEAEVYLAYGRREKAIAILEAASRANPGDDNLRKRLFELKVGT